MQEMLPAVRTCGCVVTDVLDLVYPVAVSFTFTFVCRVINTPFVTRMKRQKLSKQWKNSTPLLLKGERHAAAAQR